MSEDPKPKRGVAQARLPAEPDLAAGAERPFTAQWHQLQNMEQAPAPANTDWDKIQADIEAYQSSIKKLEIKCNKLAFQNERMAGIITYNLKTTANHGLDIIDKDRDNAVNVERIALLKEMFRLCLKSYVFKIGTFRILSFKKFEALLKDRNIFDSEGYLARYPDVRNAKIDPASHFAAHGISEGRNKGFE